MKTIPGYDGYSATYDGRIYSHKSSRYLTQSDTQFGYRRVYVSVDGKSKSPFAHRLVALAYIANPDNKPYVNHIDNDRQNNNVANLEWCTARENTAHSIKTRTRCVGAKHNFAKLTEEQASEIKHSTDGAMSLSRRYSVSPELVWKIRTGQLWKHLA